MNDLEKEEQEATDIGLQIDYVPFKSENIKGLYCDGSIAISNHIDTCVERACILAEELGHFHTSSGIILNMESAVNQKQENSARLWAYNKMVTIEKLISAKEAGCSNRYEIAEHLNVTESFLQEAIDCYRSKYGLGFQKGEYIILFEPFNICKMSSE
ncbi:ImmA/IrrE family metallo-endopeptidase [Lacrimispora indolis]|uniref:ImmA/IrrE family metallo-endopeptidase n=1 Tax=Lacrimispora indolis TaxID=69825 RepID=UPI00045EBE81|nr:ImmA/IrrE family metallo-endopeptidase [Lacrimispora indolis]